MLDKLILRLQALGVDVRVTVYAAQGFGSVTYEVEYMIDGVLWMVMNFATQARAIDHINGLVMIIDTVMAKAVATQGK